MVDSFGRIHDTADGGYLAHAVLDARALDSIRETNEGFLALVAERHAARPGSAVFGLTGAAAGGIAALDARRRRSAASCPYTLFNLRFEDTAFWSDVALEARLAGSGSVADEATFARTAVFLAWHLAQHSELTARVVLGMTTPVHQAWRTLPLSAIDRAATAALPHLTARWGDHPLFWPKLVESPESAARAGGASVRLLGLQLLAADGIRADGAWSDGRLGE